MSQPLEYQQELLPNLPAVSPFIEQQAQFITPEFKGFLLVEAGMTAAQFMDIHVPEQWRGATSIFIDGAEVIDPEHYVLQTADHVTLIALPQGGGNNSTLKTIIGAIAMVVIAVVSYGAGAAASAALVGSYGATTAGMIGLGVQMSIMMVGMLAINALIPPPALNTNSLSQQKAANTYGFGGQSNVARHYQPVLKLYGTHRIFPAIAANPLVKNTGKTGTIKALYDFGSGYVHIRDIKIGDTDVVEFNPKIYIHTNSFCTNLVLNTRAIGYDAFSYVLKYNNAFTTQTRFDTVGIDVDVNFHQGLFTVDKTTGVYSRANVSFLFRWRPIGGIWTSVGANHVFGMQSVNNSSPVGGFIIRYRLSNQPSLLHDFNSTSSANLIKQALKFGAKVTWVIDLFNEDEYLRKYPQIRGSGWTGTGQAYFEQVGWRSTNPYVTNYFTVTGEYRTPIGFTVNINFPVVGEYEVEITRLTPDSTVDTLYNESVLTTMRSFGAGSVVNLRQRHTMLEMELLATDKINGVVQNLSAIASSVLPITNDGVNFSWAETSNPARIAIDILCGEANPNPLAYTALDYPSWLKLVAICDQPWTVVINGLAVTRPRYSCNIVIDYSSTVQELVNSVLGGCRASLIVTTAGKYGVLIDELKTTPRQLITPANSWNFGGSRTYSNVPHALRVSWINPNMDWQKDEIVVYNDGYSEANATEFEELGTFGITNYSEAWSHGRYMLAQGLLRSETFSVTMDIENLILQRGDRVDIAHDVPQVGGFPTRIVEVNANVVVIAHPLSIAPTNYTVRLSNGTVRTGTLTLVDPVSFALDNISGIAEDDLIILGLANRVTDAYIVSRISAGADLTAEVTLVQYIPEIYDVDHHPIPDWNPGFGENLIGRTNLVTSNLRITQKLIYIERFPYVDVLLDWTTTGFDLHHHLISGSMIGENAPQLAAETNHQHWDYRLSPLHQSVLFDYPITFEVTPVSGQGYQGTSALGVIQLLKDTTPPIAPRPFTVEVGRINTIVDWGINPEPDIDYYEIRFAAKGIVPVWDGAEFIAIVGWSVNNYVYVGRKVGTFMIKAVDTSGNWSNVSYALPDTKAPGAPISFALNVDKERIQLFWIRPVDNDISHFSIRYSPTATLTPDWNASQLLMNVPHDATSVAVGARTGTYMIRSYDTSNNVSAMSFRRTTVETIPDINVIDTVDDSPAWLGTHINTKVRGSSLVMIDPALTAGYYTYETVFTLGDIYETKITSKIDGYGELNSDMMITWPNLLDINVPALSNAQSDQWNAWLEVRYTTAVSFIASWVTMDSVLNMAEGSGEVWTPWRPVETGVFTGNVFHFRIQMRSYDGLTKPVVMSGLVEIDMPDRTFYLPDVAIPAGGQVIAFDPPFRSMPVLGVSVDGTIADLYYRLSNKSQSSVEVNLFDRATNTPAAGKIDLQAKGYGRLRPTVI
jgi:predicted phage tail protein